MIANLGQRATGTRNTPAFLPIDALAQLVSDGNRVSISGFHFCRLPVALINAICQTTVRDLHYICWGGSLGLELLLEAGKIGRMELCFNSLDVFGLSPRFRAAVEQGTIPFEDLTDTILMEGHRAARHGMASLGFPLPLGSDLVKQSSWAITGTDPVSQQAIGFARSIPLDVFLLHAQRADTDGNIEIQGARGLDLAAIFASRDVLATVEEIVPAGTFQQTGAPRSFVLPRTFVRAIAIAPSGAWPTACLPYYPADYRALARVTRETPLHVGEPDGDRRTFLAAAATASPKRITAGALRHVRPNDAPVPPGPTVDEIMVTWLAHQYDNDSVCSVGSFSPLAFTSYLLAKRTHAPRLAIMSFNGGYIDIGVRPMLLMLAEPLDFQTAVLHCGGDDSFHWYYQRGLITHEVVSAAQIDRKCQTNNFSVTSPSGRMIRLPGQGGMADVANMHRHFMLYLTRHSPMTMVEQVERVSAARGLLTAEERLAAGLQPGVVRLITNLAVFALDEDERELVLTHLHPGVSLAEVQEATGFPLRVADRLQETPLPTAEELRLIRDEIDPLGMRQVEFIAGKERGPLLDALIAAEERVIVDLIGLPPG